MSSEKPILIFGAGGNFGRYVAPELDKRGAHVRGLVHHDQADAVARRNCVTDIVRADLRDPEALTRSDSAHHPRRDSNGDFAYH